MPRTDARSTVATLLYIEAAIVLAVGLWLIVFSFTHENEELAPLLGEISFAVIGALWLFAAGRGYARGKTMEDLLQYWLT